MSAITIAETARCRAPKHLGLNVEVFDHAGRSNLWDWLADSGAAVARVFHPERSLRRAEAPTARWDAVVDATAFEAFRQDLLVDPERTIPWETYLFMDPLPWLGVPDEIVKGVLAVGAQPICSLGFDPRSYPHPLVRDLTAATADAAGIDWRAAAAAYEYYLAEVWRYTSGHGVRYYSMHNEPDWLGTRNFYLPDGLASHPLGRLVQRRDEPQHQAYRRAIALQCEVMARMARRAIDDVTERLTADDRKPDIQLAGPTCGPFKADLWPQVRNCVDIFDYHQYATDPAAFKDMAAVAGNCVDRDDIRLGMTEFGRRPGAIRPEEILFNHSASLELADILMTMLTLEEQAGYPYELLAFYILAAPSTHRNYKHLVYGDMNMLDWTGVDAPLHSRGKAWYPSFDELQLRWPTPAYSVFRMLARCTRGGNAEVLPSADSGDLRIQPVRSGDALFINILNPTREAIADIRLQVPAAFREHTAALRITTRRERDQLVRLLRPDDAIEVPAECLMQLWYAPTAITPDDELHIREETQTPGGLEPGLSRWQTTRLRAVVAATGEDITERLVQWRSSDPECVRVSQSGLLQRLRGTDAVCLTAAVPDGPEQTITLAALPA